VQCDVTKLSSFFDAVAQNKHDWKNESSILYLYTSKISLYIL